MDKRPHIKPYLYAMLAGFGAISLSILLFFLIYRFKGLGDAVSELAGILMPFIYGGAIAYALKPVCNFLDRSLRQALPPRYHRVVGPVSVTGSILFGILLVYALLLMIIPQLYNSILTLSATLPARLDALVSWLSGQYFADNEIIRNFLIEAYDTLSESVGKWVNDTMMPYMQDLVSGVGQSVWTFVSSGVPKAASPLFHDVSLKSRPSHPAAGASNVYRPCHGCSYDMGASASIGMSSAPMKR